MADTFIASKGCVYVPKRNRTGGFYALSPEIVGGQGTPVILDGADTTDNDIVYPVTTLDDNKYIYTFGEDFGNIAISGMALLGTVAENGRSFRAVVDYFNTHRSSNQGGTPVTLSLPGNSAVKVLLTSLSVSKADPEFHIQFFMFRGIGVEPIQA